MQGIARQVDQALCFLVSQGRDRVHWSLALVIMPSVAALMVCCWSWQQVSFRRVMLTDMESAARPAGLRQECRRRCAG